jgi:hypothetical protein
MIFHPDPVLGPGWVRSNCGRYRLARIDRHDGSAFVAWDWHQALPEMLGRCTSSQAAARLCELNRLYGGAP